MLEHQKEDDWRKEKENMQRMEETTGAVEKNARMQQIRLTWTIVDQR